MLSSKTENNVESVNTNFARGIAKPEMLACVLQCGIVEDLIAGTFLELHVGHRAARINCDLQRNRALIAHSLSESRIFRRRMPTPIANAGRIFRGVGLRFRWARGWRRGEASGRKNNRPFHWNCKRGTGRVRGDDSRDDGLVREYIVPRFRLDVFLSRLRRRLLIRLNDFHGYGLDHFGKRANVYLRRSQPDHPNEKKQKTDGICPRQTTIGVFVFLRETKL